MGSLRGFGMIGVNKGALNHVNPNLKLELKFNYQTYTDLAASVSATTNDYVRAWKSTVGGHLLTQSTDAARPMRQSDALYFDGGDAVFGSFSLIINQSWCIEFWYMEASPVGIRTFFHLYGTTTGLFMTLVDNTNLLIADASGGNQSISTTFSNTANTWCHLALSFDGTTYRLFKNGSLLTSSTSPTLTATTITSIVISGNSSGNYKPAIKMTDFRIYNIAKYTANFTSPTRSA
jgi:hypothetical protein